MKVHVRLHGTLPNHYQGVYPDNGLMIELDGVVSVAELVDHIGLARERVGLVTINGQLARAEDLVPDGAQIKILQSIAGG